MTGREGQGDQLVLRGWESKGGFTTIVVLKGAGGWGGVDKRTRETQDNRWALGGPG